MDTTRVRAVLKELENAGNADRLVEVLTESQNDFKPTEQSSRETKIGVAVNKSRSHSDARVSSLVKKLVSAWREQVQQQKARQQRAKSGDRGASAGGASSTGGSASAGSASAGGASTSASTTTTGTNHTTKAATATPPASTSGGASEASTRLPAKPGKSAANTPKSDAARAVSGKKRDWKTDGVDTAVYSEPVRNSCIQVTYNALVINSSEPPHTVSRAAKNVEAAVFEHEKNTGTGYRNKMRSSYMYLKDPKNPMSREQVVLGKISGERSRTMKPQEMANDESKRQMEEIEKQNSFNAQSAQEQRSTTDRFTCGKCKHKKVSYYQMQTRSADEPSTTFCTCENCGNRWKFS